MEERIKMELLTPLSGNLTSYELEQEWEAGGCGDIFEGIPLDGNELVQYGAAIQEAIQEYDRRSSSDGTRCNLMDYFDGSVSVKGKVMSAVPSVKEVDGVLYGCTTLELKEPLEAGELAELCEYLTGQYSDGWGEGFEQQEIRVDGEDLYVHFWQSDDQFCFREVPAQESVKNMETPDQTVSRPKLKLLGHDGSVFAIMGDASCLLRANGQSKEADEMIQRVNDSGNYYKALGIISEYVETELSVPEKSYPPKDKEKNQNKSSKERGR